LIEQRLTKEEEKREREREREREKSASKVHNRKKQQTDLANVAARW
jgi:hypothetical protein